MPTWFLHVSQILNSKGFNASKFPGLHDNTWLYMYVDSWTNSLTLLYQLTCLPVELLVKLKLAFQTYAYWNYFSYHNGFTAFRTVFTAHSCNFHCLSVTVIVQLQLKDGQVFSRQPGLRPTNLLTPSMSGHLRASKARAKQVLEQNNDISHGMVPDVVWGTAR